MKNKIFLGLFFLVLVMSMNGLVVSLSIPEDFGYECSVYGGREIEEGITGYEFCQNKGYNDLCLVDRFETNEFYTALNTEIIRNSCGQIRNILYENTRVSTMACVNKLISNKEECFSNSKHVIYDQVICCKKQLGEANISDYCWDSDGEDYYTIGASKWIKDGEYGTADDGCKTETILYERICEDEKIPDFVQYDCADEEMVCKFGRCVEETPSIICYSNEDCPPEEERFCNEEGQACSTITSYECQNPGTPESKCVMVGGGGGCANCAEGKVCEEGICVEEKQGLFKRMINKITGKIIDLFS